MSHCVETLEAVVPAVNSPVEVNVTQLPCVICVIPSYTQEVLSWRHSWNLSLFCVVSGAQPVQTHTFKPDSTEIIIYSVRSQRGNSYF